MQKAALPGFPFGTEVLETPPDLAGAELLDAPGLPPHPAPADLWRQAAREAAGRCSALLPAGERLALVVPDRTRPLPLAAVLPVFLEELARAGIPPGRITLAPASGIHKPMGRAELVSWVGPVAAETGLLLAAHDADAPGLLLGQAEGELPVVAHPAVARAGAILVLGRIVFHYLAGFGGGRKLLVPGVAARRTVLAMHSRCLSPVPGEGRHPAARAGILEGNPVHLASCAAARLFPPAVAVHVMLGSGGAVSDIVVGDLFEDHARSCARYAAANLVQVDGLFDAVVVSGGGHPSDRDMVQAHKALDAVAPIVRRGGSVVFVAACGDGVGNGEVQEGLRLGKPPEIEAELRRDFRVGVHTALAWAEKTHRLRVLGVTRLPPELLPLARVESVATLALAAAELRRRHGPAARLGLAPRGGALIYKLGG